LLPLHSLAHRCRYQIPNFNLPVACSILDRSVASLELFTLALSARRCFHPFSTNFACSSIHAFIMSEASASPPATDSISARLRIGTTPEHRSAEQKAFLVALMSGKSALRPQYVRYLAQFARVYEEMERSPARSTDPKLLHDTALHRFASIHSDLLSLGSADWRESIPALPATERYVEHLRSFGEGDGVKRLAHHYTRYLGDLSGGQIISRLLKRHYSASDDVLSFYHFPQIENLAEYKKMYREELDNLEVDEHAVQQLIEEAKRAFACSADILDGLAEEDRALPEPRL
jgi:heme oxygenase